MSETAPAAATAGAWVTARLGATGYRTAIDARTHAFAADEPRDVGGEDTAATPYELLLGAVAACTAMTMRMYAARKGWPLGDVTVRLRAAASHAADCERCEVEDVDVGRLEREIAMTGALTAEQRARLVAVADRCPIKQTLERGIRVGGAPLSPTAAPASG
jgi:putative redox protein